MNLEDRFLSTITSARSFEEAIKRNVSDDFFILPGTKKIFSFCLDYYTQYGVPPSPHILKERFGYDVVPVAEPVGGIVDELIRRYRSNQIEQLLLSATDKLSVSPDESLDFIIDKSHEILLKTKDKSRTYDYIEGVDERVKYYNEIRGGNFTMGCPTGWSFFDEWTLGLQRGELAVLVAPTGQGKTYLMCRMAVGAYALGWNPIIISFEPTIKSIYSRLDSIVARVNPKRYRTGQLTDEEYQQYLRRMDFLKTHDRPFVIIKPINNSVAAIVEAIHEYRYRTDEQWVVFIDQMSWMSSHGDGFEFYKNLFLEINKVISENHLNIPCWLLAQINREGMRARQAQLYHIALSSFAEQFADMVLSLTRDSEAAILRLLKFREGLPADFTMRLDFGGGVIEVGGIVASNA